VATTLLGFVTLGDQAFFVILLATHSRAQQACTHLTAGMRVLVDGTLWPHVYFGADGREHPAVMVVVNEQHALASEPAHEDRFDWDPAELDQAISVNDQDWLDWLVRVVETGPVSPGGAV
jgi:hypothetical protein